MKRRFDDYSRLARGLFGASSLWLGPKDLLSVRGSGVLLPFVEDYCRFELERIQSAAIIKTRTGLVLNLVYGGLALLMASLGGAAIWQGMTGGGTAEPIFYALAIPLVLVATVSLVLFIINFALGPTCHFQIQTATRVERIRSVRRLRSARRVLARLTPALLAAQGPASGGGGSEVRERIEGTDKTDRANMANATDLPPDS